MSSGKLDFSQEKIMAMGARIMPVNALKNIESYNDEMTISQVVRFFERQGISFTKTMIQNYVRVGLIPPPVEKRYYIKGHLILLTIIDSLKDVYSLDEISGVFKTIMNDVDTFEDDLIDMSAVYNQYILLYEKSVKEWLEDLPNILEDVEKTAEAMAERVEDREKVARFLTAMTLMVQSMATKQLVKMIMENSGKE